MISEPLVARDLRRPEEMEALFRTDIEAIRKRAREKMDEGMITAAYGLEPGHVVEVLNEVLATETVCTLRYKNHYYMASGIHSQAVADEFLEHATQEQQHADRVAARIAQLGGTPNLNPTGLATRSHAEYREVDTLKGMIEENLVAERIAIETYAEIVRWLGERDVTTRRLIEDILAQEEEHATDLLSLLERFGNGH